MKRNILVVVTVVNILTGLQLTISPETFYNTFPGVSMLGPYNVHFMRDAGLSFGASGLLLGLGWRRCDYVVCLAGALWPVFHALFHLQMWLARGLPVDLVAVVNLFGIQLPAWAAFVAALLLYREQGRQGQ